MSKIVWHSKHPVLDAAYEIVSLIPNSNSDATRKAAWREAEAIVLGRVAAYSDTIRLEIRDAGEREKEYAKVWAKAKRDLFRHLWSQFSEVRKVFYSSELDNNQADLADYLGLQPTTRAAPLSTAATYNPALFH